MHCMACAPSESFRFVRDSTPVILNNALFVHRSHGHVWISVTANFLRHKTHTLCSAYFSQSVLHSQRSWLEIKTGHETRTYATCTQTSDCQRKQNTVAVLFGVTQEETGRIPVDVRQEFNKSTHANPHLSDELRNFEGYLLSCLIRPFLTWLMRRMRPPKCRP